MHQELGRPSFAEAVVSETLGHNQRLERIDDAVDWVRLGEIVAGVHAAPRGRPSYPPLLMVKVLLLEQWYNLSDPQMEEALGDRLSFRRFVGLGLEDDTPDHSTISRFRQALEVDGLSARLFTELAAQLDAQGLVLKQGTLLDATLVAAQVRRPPLAAGPGAPSRTDPDVAWTRRGARSHFGYQVHLGVDEETGLVRRAVLTPANVAESEVADALVSGDEGAVYADKAYESTRRRQWLKRRGINDRIMHRSHKNQPALPYWQQRRNDLIAPRRALVEKVFGTLKRSYGYQRVRYRGLGRNDVEMWFKLMAFNLRKADTLAWGGGLTAGPVRLAPGTAARDPVPSRPPERRTGLPHVPMPLPTHPISNYSKVSTGNGYAARCGRSPAGWPRRGMWTPLPWGRFAGRRGRAVASPVHESWPSRGGQLVRRMDNCEPIGVATQADRRCGDRRLLVVRVLGYAAARERPDCGFLCSAEPGLAP